MGALYLVALTNLFAMLPAAPGYVGTFDAAVIFGVKAIGGTGSAARLLPAAAALHPVRADHGRRAWSLLVVRYGGWQRVALGRQARDQPGLGRRAWRRPRHRRAGFPQKRPAGASRPDARAWPVGLASAAWLLAALDAALPSTPTYDPWAWILWGREILHLDLAPRAGRRGSRCRCCSRRCSRSSARTPRPYLWLWIAARGRAARAARWASGSPAARRRGAGLGGVAGIAALALFSSFKLRPRRGARQLRGAAGGARAVGVRAPSRRPPRPRALPRRRGALLRPEVWPFLGLYGLWLWFVEPRLRLRDGRASRRCHPGALVPARSGGGRATRSGLEPRQRAEPRQRRVRRPPGARAVEGSARRRRAGQARRGGRRRLRRRRRAGGAARRERADARARGWSASPGSRSSRR